MRDMRNFRASVVAAAGIVLLTVALYLLFFSGRGYQSISAKAAIKIMESDQDYQIVDVRQDDEYANGHIPGAVNLPLNDIQDGKTDILTDPEQLLLIYCHTGRRSKAAAEKLVELGYQNVCEFGGIVDWPGEIVKEAGVETDNEIDSETDGISE